MKVPDTVIFCFKADCLGSEPSKKPESSINYYTEMLFTFLSLVKKGK